jgi:hypothetical protein
MRYWPAEEAAQAMGACGPVVDEAVIECMFCFVLRASIFFFSQDIGYSPSCDFISSRLVNFVVTVVNNFEEPQFLQGKDKGKEPTVSLA